MAGSANTSRIDPRAPLVIVGQARSGSSLLTLMLNRGGGGFVVNDAYALQAADALGLTGGRGADAALRRYGEACLGILRARSVAAGPAPIHRSVVASPESLARAEAAAEAAVRAAGARAAAERSRARPSRAAVSGEPGEDEGGAPPIERAGTAPAWAAVWGAALHAAAERSAFWGWNTPPDHLRAAEILAAFPKARLLFLFRDPWAVLRSYKTLPEHWGRERARYHPALQARAWAAAARSFRRLADAAPDRIHAVRYEDLLRDPEATLAEIARFVGAPVAALDPATLPANGSRPGGGLTEAELRAARFWLGHEPARFGYLPPAPCGAGFADLLRCTARAGRYYAAEAVRSRDMRARILRMVRA